MKKSPPERVETSVREAERAEAIKNIRSEGSIDPEFITIPGWDNDDEESDQWVPSAADPVDEPFALKVIRETQLVAVQIVKIGDRVEPVDGRTRIKALRWWNANNPEEAVKVKYVKVSGVSGKDRARRAVACNEHRKVESVVTRARMCVRLNSKYGESWRDIADLYDVTVQTIAEWVSTLDLAPEIQLALDEGLPKSQADHVADMSHDDQAAALDLARETGAPLANVVADLKGEVPQRAARPRGNSHNPSSRPGLVEIRGSVEDKTIDDSAITWRQALQWVLGDRTYLLTSEDSTQ